MGTADISNANVMQVDWARGDRLAAIAKAPRSRTRNGKRPSASVWMVDAAASDRRSVKFYLGGGFSIRVAWWTIFSTVHQLFSRSGSLEAAMIRYHRIHHAVTLAVIRNVHETRALSAAITRDGVMKATCAHAIRLVDEMKATKSK